MSFHRKKETIQLTMCPRANHSDQPLQKPVRRCYRRTKDGLCPFYPSLQKLLKEQGIKYTFNTKFKCVLQEVV